MSCSVRALRCTNSNTFSVPQQRFLPCLDDYLEHAVHTSNPVGAVNLFLACIQNRAKIRPSSTVHAKTVRTKSYDEESTCLPIRRNTRWLHRIINCLLPRRTKVKPAGSSSGLSFC